MRDQCDPPFSVRAIECNSVILLVIQHKHAVRRRDSPSYSPCDWLCRHMMSGLIKQFATLAQRGRSGDGRPAVELGRLRHVLRGSRNKSTNRYKGNTKNNPSESLCILLLVLISLSFVNIMT